MAQKGTVWHFTDNTERDAHGASEGVQDGDFCVVLSPRGAYLFDTGGAKWRPHNAENHALGTGSVNAGSTNTRIRRYDTRIETGDQFTWTDSATDGSYVTVAADGIYAVSTTYEAQGAGAAVALAINASGSLSNTFLGTHTKAPSFFVSTTANLAFSWTGKLAASDKVWISTSTVSAAGGAVAHEYQFLIVKLLDL